MSDLVTDTLRQAMGALARIAPDPPELPDVSTALPRPRRSPIVVFGVAFIAVLAVGVVSAVLINRAGDSNGAGRGLPADTSVGVLNDTFASCSDSSVDGPDAVGFLHDVYTWVAVAETGALVESELGSEASPSMIVITVDGDPVDVVIHRSYFDGIEWTLRAGGDIWLGLADPATTGGDNLVGFVLAFTADGQGWFPGSCAAEVMYEPLLTRFGAELDERLHDVVGKTGPELDAALGVVVTSSTTPATTNEGQGIPVPEALRVAQREGNEVVLTWQAVEGAVEYVLYVGDVVWLRSEEPRATVQLEVGGTYPFRVSAVDANGAESPRSHLLRVSATERG
jgi:hypothetical protein